MTDQKFWDRIAARYAQRPIADEAAYQRKIELTQARLSPEMRVLELGCGTGGTALLHAPHVAEILATDVSPAMIAIARERAAEAGADNATFAAEDHLTAGADGAPWDAVLALNLLHLLPDWREAVARIHQMTRPGGLFISSTACLADGFGFLRYIVPIGRTLGRMPQLAFFTADALAAEITAAGFTIEERWAPDKRTLFLIARKPE